MGKKTTDQTLTPPDWLTKPARSEFKKLVRQLGDEAKPSDFSLYCDYAQTLADIQKLTEEVEKTGFTVITESGVKVNPAAALLTTTRNQLAALRRDLNLTPKARSEKTKAKRAAPFGGL